MCCLMESRLAVLLGFILMEGWQSCNIAESSQAVMKVILVLAAVKLCSNIIFATAMVLITITKVFLFLFLDKLQKNKCGGRDLNT